MKRHSAGGLFRVSFLGLFCLLTAVACEKPAAPKKAAESVSEAALEAPKPSPRSLALLLALAQFKSDAENKSIPGPAKLIMLKQNGESFRPEIILDDESLVFHKAYCRPDDNGKGGIMTIGATKAALKYWQRGADGQLKSTTLYEGKFGGKWDRLRDIEEGDLDGDGAPEQLIATHDQGVILIGRKVSPAGKWQYEEIMRKEATFIHEVEIGDLNGDGQKEFYATPSAPNKMGSTQSGAVIRGRYLKAEKSWNLEEIAVFEGRHAKEILTYDFDGDGKDELYISLEAQLDEAGQELKPLEIRQVTMDKSGELQQKSIAMLPGRGARVLTPVHLQKDEPGLLITTMGAGIFVLSRGKGGSWQKLLVDRDSQGFEHAALAIDSDGDGRDEIFVSAEKQGTFSRYTYTGGGFEKRVLMRLNPRDIVWNITACTAEEAP